MIDLKTVGQLAKQDAEDREFVTRTSKNPPNSPWRDLAVDSIEQAEQLTEELAKQASKVANDPVQ